MNRAPHGRRPRTLVCFLAALSAGACAADGGEPPAGRGSPPAGWDDGLRQPEAPDRNPAPDVVEIDLEARVASIELVPGTPSPVWTFGGVLPGPLIRVPAGARLLVHFHNNLPEETTVHWHGVRLTADMDGVPEHSQPVVLPGASFDYAFTVPDSGLFWYHPHVRSAKQVGDGLYGALLVEPRRTGTASDEPPGLGDELVMVLSDIGIDADGSLSDPASGGELGTLFGREGNVVLVNGRIAPTIVSRIGRRQRWRIVNTAKTRYFQIALEGHRFVRIGGDGGLLPAPQEMDMVVLTPGERADLLVTPQGEPGARLPVRWVPFNRGFGSYEYRSEVEMFFLQLAAAPPFVEDPVPATLRDIVPLDVSSAVPRAINLTQATIDNKFVLGINGVPSWQAEPMHAQVGDTELWTVTNEMEWDHPFHLHGFFFQPVDLGAGLLPARPEWKDTLNVPRDQTVTFAVRYDDRPGMWMFHCHILDHADAGMMGMIHLTR